MLYHCSNHGNVGVSIIWKSWDAWLYSISIILVGLSISFKCVTAVTKGVLRRRVRTYVWCLYVCVLRMPSSMRVHAHNGRLSYRSLNPLLSFLYILTAGSSRTILLLTFHVTSGQGLLHRSVTLWLCLVTMAVGALGTVRGRH